MLSSAVSESAPTRWTSGQAMSLLAAATAHELNNPLAVIVGYLSLILSGKIPPERVTEELQKLQAEAKHCRNVLEGLTQLAESTRGEEETVELTALLRELMHELCKRAPRLTVSFESAEPLFVTGREHGLLQLFRHLLDNAAESSARSLRLEAGVESGWLRVRIVDDGVGFRANELARAKEPFFSTKAERLGLGLSICELVASDHGGSLELASEPGRGTTAIVRLPLAPSIPESRP